jgi:hypothetical protein
MRDKWETNMILHTAFGSLISFATMFWGFWAISNKKGWETNTYPERIIGSGTNPNGTGKYLHTFSAMTVPLMSVPLVLTGFIAYFRRW